MEKIKRIFVFKLLIRTATGTYCLQDKVINYKVNAQYKEKLPFDSNSIFSIKTEDDFNKAALAVFNFQYKHNPVYQTYCKHLKVVPEDINRYEAIPFLPISFFKTHKVAAFQGEPEVTFSSSGTTGSITSKHPVKELAIYKQSFMAGFEAVYGSIKDYVVIGLLPSYLEREGSSLIYMVDHLIKASNQAESGFFLNEYDALLDLLNKCKNKKVVLIGVSYALLDFGEKYRPQLKNTIIMETGGMKGKRKEMIKSELHATLKSYFGVEAIHSEYGMTELLSQAYSVGTAFTCPPWMKILTRSYTDPLSLISHKTGGINVIDLANIYSCSFIATQDLGKVYPSHFEVVGRFDNSDIRGCNLLVQ